MDLYIQIGVILLLLTALSLFIYVFTLNGATFTTGITEVNDVVQKRANASKDAIINTYDNKKDMTGRDVIRLIESTKVEDLAIIVVSERSQFSLLYGNRFTWDKPPTTQLHDYADISGYPRYSETIYRNRIVGEYTLLSLTNTPPRELFNEVAPGRTLTSVMNSYSQNRLLQMGTELRNSPQLTLFGEHTTPDSIDTVEEITSITKRTTNSGRVYTEQTVVKHGYFSDDYIDESSLFYVTPNVQYRTMLIEDMLGNIVGVFAYPYPSTHNRAIDVVDELG